MPEQSVCQSCYVLCCGVNLGYSASAEDRPCPVPAVSLLDALVP